MKQIFFMAAALVIIPAMAAAYDFNAQASGSRYLFGAPQFESSATESSGAGTGIDNAYAVPSRVRPGKIVLLKVNYTLSSPDPGKPVRLIYTILWEGNLIGRAEVGSVPGNGTYTISVPFHVLNKTFTVQNGTFTVFVRMEGEGSFRRVFSFTVNDI